MARAFNALPSDWPVAFALLLLALLAFNIALWREPIFTWLLGH
jgi:hypothetical protein